MESEQFNVKTGSGLLLILIGIMGIFWLAYCILCLFKLTGDNTAGVPILGALLSYYETDNILKVPGGIIELPKAFYYIAGILLYIFILCIIERITRALLKTGANLLENELDAIADKFKKELANLKGIVIRSR